MALEQPASTMCTKLNSKSGKSVIDRRSVPLELPTLSHKGVSPKPLGTQLASAGEVRLSPRSDSLSLGVQRRRKHHVSSATGEPFPPRAPSKRRPKRVSPKVRFDENYSDPSKPPWLVKAMQGAIGLSETEMQHFLEACFQEYVKTRCTDTISEKQMEHLIVGLLGFHHSENIEIACRKAFPFQLLNGRVSEERKFYLNDFMHVLHLIREALPDSEFGQFIAGRHFICCGDAALLVRALDPCVKVDLPRQFLSAETNWRP